MKNLFFVTTLMAGSLFLVSCEPGANTGNKSANATANNANAVAPVNTATIEADIKKLVMDGAASMAKNDFEALDKNTTDNYMFVAPDGTVIAKAERLASIKSGDSKLESLTYEDVNVRVNAEGTGAIAIGKATAKGTNMGKPVDGVFRSTQVWSKTKDGWKMASGQVTPITANTGEKKADDQKGSDADKKAPSANDVPKAAPAANK